MALSDLRALAVGACFPCFPLESARGNTGGGAEPEEIRHLPAPVSPVSPVSPENGNVGRDEATAARVSPVSRAEPKWETDKPLILDCVSRVSRVSPKNHDAGGIVAAPRLSGIAEASDVLADREAIAAEEPGRVAPPSTPPADLVERLAAAMAAPRPWQRVAGDPAPALAYFMGQARRRLAPLDGLARGLLVQAAEDEARRWAAHRGQSEQKGETNV